MAQQAADLRLGEVVVQPVAGQQQPVAGLQVDQVGADVEIGLAGQGAAEQVPLGERGPVQRTAEVLDAGGVVQPLLPSPCLIKVRVAVDGMVEGDDVQLAAAEHRGATVPHVDNPRHQRAVRVHWNDECDGCGRRGAGRGLGSVGVEDGQLQVGDVQRPDEQAVRIGAGCAGGEAGLHVCKHGSGSEAGGGAGMTADAGALVAAGPTDRPQPRVPPVESR